MDAIVRELEVHVQNCLFVGGTLRVEGDLARVVVGSFPLPCWFGIGTEKWEWDMFEVMSQWIEVMSLKWNFLTLEILKIFWLGKIYSLIHQIPLTNSTCCSIFTFIKNYFFSKMTCFIFNPINSPSTFHLNQLVPWTSCPTIAHEQML